ncbi:MAG: pyrroloquinoline quinone biosynthesis protein PqqB [Planctomycetaceae bacterium]|nr:pyrroloquinoline quinone biosynthesis protein PqqB [Planctomycetaceae bacterium]
MPCTNSMRTHWQTLALSCLIAITGDPAAAQKTLTPRPFVLVLGIAQDGGFPQAGCRRRCCQAAIRTTSKRRMVTSLAIVDPLSHQRWLIDCTPHFPDQLRLLDTAAPPSANQPLLDGIFLTHAHVGHYTGLVNLGREVMGTQNIAVHAMPRMAGFLSTQGPWSLLVKLNNIQIKPLQAGQVIRLGKRIQLTPILVPHRDEFSETVGFLINGPERSVVFIPDIDKWEHWNRRIEQLIVTADRAYLDGTFFDGQELPNRDITKVPHPFIIESIQRFAALADTQRSKVHFIHLNHTNPALAPESPAAKAIRHAGMYVAEQGTRYSL